MINLLGERKQKTRVDHAEEAFKAVDGHLHIYGKLDSRNGRKMGHYTLLGDDLKNTYEEAQKLTQTIEI